jgi:lysophospholipase L1-like esterase
MYRFEIIAHTYLEQTIGLVGSIPELGAWDSSQVINLQTSDDRYPVWWVEIDIPVDEYLTATEKIEYKYLRIHRDGRLEWESLSKTNRWLPIEPAAKTATLVMHDGGFGFLQPWPYGYWDQPKSSIPTLSPEPKQGKGGKIAVIGSSVALGCNAWLNHGWAQRLGTALKQSRGYELVNLSQKGANATSTCHRFNGVVPPHQPDIVIIALSLGNEGLAHCLPYERPAAQQRFESGLAQLIAMVRELGAKPMLGGLYPHGDYTHEHYLILQETHERLKTWDVPMLDWLSVLDNGYGRWREGLSFDPAHPNTAGHRLMYEAIDLTWFMPPVTAQKKKSLTLIHP